MLTWVTSTYNLTRSGLLLLVQRARRIPEELSRSVFFVRLYSYGVPRGRRLAEAV